MTDSDQPLQRYAELAVGVGANVAEGQLVEIPARLDHAPLVREVAHEAYRAGARYADARSATLTRRRSPSPAIPRLSCFRTSTASASARRG